MQNTNNNGAHDTQRPRAFWVDAGQNLRSPKIIGALALSAGPILYFARNLIQVLVVLFVIVLFIPSWPNLRNTLMRRARENWGIFVFVAIGFLSVFWSLDASVSLERALRLVWEFSIGLMLIISFTSLEERRRRLVIEFCATGFSIAAIYVTFYMVLYQWLSDDQISRIALYDMASNFSRGAAIHAILAVPLGFSLWKLNKRKASALVVISALTVTGATLKLSPELAIAVSLISFGAVLLMPRIRYGFYALQIGLLIFMPLLLPLPSQDKIICEVAQKKRTAAHRIVIWNFADQKIAERPILGWGLNTSRLVPGHETRINLADFCTGTSPAVKNIYSSMTSMPLHPHNVPLQIWLEMGAIGIAAAALLVWTIIARVQAAFPARLQLAVFTATFSAAYMILFVSFSLFQGWLMASLFFVAACLPLCLKNPEPL